MLVTALVGVVVNIAAAWCMSQGQPQRLNVEGAFQHMLTDLFAFIATAVAGVVVLPPASSGPTPSPRWSSWR